MKKAAAVVCLALLSGCAVDPAKFASHPEQVEAFRQPLPFRLDVIDVRLETPPTLDERQWAAAILAQLPNIWRANLQTALLHANAFQPTAAAKARLTVRLIDIDLPDSNLSKTAAYTARYEVAAADDNAAILSRSISTSATIPASFAISGGARRHEAISQAMASNINEFIVQLRPLQEPGPNLQIRAMPP